MQKTITDLFPYDMSAITDQLYIASIPRKARFRLVRLPTFDFPLLPMPLAMLWRGVRVAMASCILIARA